MDPTARYGLRGLETGPTPAELFRLNTGVLKRSVISRKVTRRKRNSVPPFGIGANGGGTRAGGRGRKAGGVRGERVGQPGSRWAVTGDAGARGGGRRKRGGVARKAGWRGGKAGWGVDASGLAQWEKRGGIRGEQVVQGSRRHSREGVGAAAGCHDGLAKRPKPPGLLANGNSGCGPIFSGAFFRGRLRAPPISSRNSAIARKSSVSPRRPESGLD